MDPGVVPCQSLNGVQAVSAVRSTQKGLEFPMENDTPTFGMLGQMAPQAMLENARKQGKTEKEINAFAASQPITPVAIKAGVVYVRDVFGRVFALRSVKPEVLEELRAKGTPFTPFANRRERRKGRAELAAKKRKSQDDAKPKKARDARRGPRVVAVDAELVKALDRAAEVVDQASAEMLKQLEDTSSRDAP